MCITPWVQLVIVPEIAKLLNTAINKGTSGVTVHTHFLSGKDRLDMPWLDTPSVFHPICQYAWSARIVDDEQRLVGKEVKVRTSVRLRDTLKFHIFRIFFAGTQVRSVRSIMIRPMQNIKHNFCYFICNVWYFGGHTTNNADTGQDETGEERAKGERAGVLFLLRQERGVRLCCAHPLPPLYQHHSTYDYHSHKQIKLNLILKSNLMLFYSISTKVRRSNWRFRLQSPPSQHRRKFAQWWTCALLGVVGLTTF